MKKKSKAFLMAQLMVLSVLCMCFTNKLEAKADGGVVIKLHYNRPDGAYDGWSVWFWEYGKDGSDYAFNEENGEMVATMEATPGTMQVGFIVRTQAWDKDVAEDQFIDISEMVSGTVHVYVEASVKGFEKDYGDDAVKGTKLSKALYNGDGTVTVKMTGNLEYDYETAFSLAGKLGEVGIKSVTQPKDYTYLITLNEELNATKSYTITFKGQVYKITMPNIYSTEDFENKYTYTGSDLGAVWSNEKTVFKVWAPTADEMVIRFYEAGDSRVSDMLSEEKMTLLNNGVWVYEKEGDCNGLYYTYAVTFDGVTKEACDPYARTTGVNGERAMVIDLASTDPEGWESDTNPHAGEGINDAVIYEAHIRDLTTEEGAGIKNAGKYIGVAEVGTQTASGIPTGLSHIIDLGVTHVQILPFYDFGSVDENKTVSGLYNWGYDPVNYNVPEGSYSTNAKDGAVRVKEVKEMVKALHDNGISVVMDVVYNHVYSAANFCYNVLVPDYFSRTTESGGYSSGSGCGNDTATERAMVRKYIVESVCYWAEEYHIDGFRFDLVGLMDVDTINEIVKEVHKTHPDVIFYGEGWSLTTTLSKEAELATQKNSSLTPGFAYFNDTIRDGIKGSVFNTSAGFVSGSAGDDTKISRCFVGLDNWCNSPSQTINYASCHDNNTLFDRLRLSCPEASLDEIIAMNKLSAAIYMTAEGVPFMQAGEEMLRTKTNSDGSYNSNSYASGDAVNTIAYSSLEDEKTLDVYNYYKGLIQFRKAHAALRMDNATDAQTYIKEISTGIDHCLAFEIDGSYEKEVSDRLMVIFNASKETQTLSLSEGEWTVCVNGDTAGIEAIETITGSVQIKPVTAMVLVQGDLGKAENPVTISSTDTDSGSAENGGKKGIAGNVAAGVCAFLAIAGGIFATSKKKKK